MKTNHARSFKARQDFKAGYRMVYKVTYKAVASSKFRAAETKLLKALRVGAIDMDVAVFPTRFAEVEDIWVWD
jgi:hypothetical protein